MRVLIFGSRNWRDRNLIRRFVAELPHHCVVVHGDHWEGADRIAKEEAEARGLRVEPHRAHWRSEGPIAGPNRNSRMAKANLDFAVGFRMPGKSNGTDDMALKAKRQGVDTYVIHRRGEGSIEEATRRLNRWIQLSIEM